MGVKPLGDRVLVERLEDDVQKTAGGIIIPDTAKEKPQRGRIVAAGPGKVTDDGKRIPMEVKTARKFCSASMRDRTSRWTTKNC